MPRLKTSDQEAEVTVPHSPRDSTMSAADRGEQIRRRKPAWGEKSSDLPTSPTNSPLKIAKSSHPEISQAVIHNKRIPVKKNSIVTSEVSEKRASLENGTFLFFFLFCVIFSVLLLFLESLSHTSSSEEDEVAKNLALIQSETIISSIPSM